MLMAIDGDHAGVIANPAARECFRYPGVPFSSLVQVACPVMAKAPHRVMLDPNKYRFSESAWIELLISSNLKWLQTTGFA